MKIFSYLMPDERISMETELFFRTSSGKGYSENDNCIFIEENAVVSFDTYFNSFSAGRYKKYTSVNSVIFGLKVCGEMEIKLKYCDLQGRETVLTSLTANHKTINTVSISCNLSEISGEGIIYPELKAISEGCVFYGCDVCTSSKAEREISLCIVTCTYKREDYVLKNIDRFKAFISGRSEDISFYVVDNGRTLPAESLSGQNVRIFHNKNYGGSGGFARGMAEVEASGRFTHFLLMDDDVSFDMESIIKTYTFLSLCRQEYSDICVGGAMLDYDFPYKQFETGAYCRNGMLCGINTNLDIRRKETILKNEKDVKSDYSSWWYMCMPAYFLGKYGLPMPFFIKFDDVEYGLRCSVRTVNINGICVLHESFDKKYSSVMEYYIRRNSLITYAIHNRGKNKPALLKEMAMQLARQFFMQRYDAMDFIYKAYEDFFKGIDFFLNTDEEQLHKELMSKSIKQEHISMEIGPPCHYSRLIRAVTLNGILIPRIFYDDMRVTDAAACTCSDSFMCRKLVHKSRGSDRGFVTHIEKRKIFKMMSYILKTGYRIIFKYDKVVSSYKNRYGEVISENFWKKHLDI